MKGLHLRSIPGGVWPGIPRGEVSQLWSMFLELERTQWLSPEELLEGQLAQVRSLLQHCERHARRGGANEPGQPVVVRLPPSRGPSVESPNRRCPIRVDPVVGD